MRQLFYWLNVAVAIVFITNSARPSVAVGFFKFTLGTELSRRTAVQLRLNAQLRAGLQIGEKDVLEKFLKFVTKSLGIKTLVFLRPLRVRLTACLRYTDWMGLEVVEFDDPRLLTARFCRKRRTLIIGTDFRVLRKVYQGSVMRDCVVAVSDKKFKKFKDFKLQSVPILTQDELNAFITKMKQMGRTKLKRKASGQLKKLSFKRREGKGKDQGKFNPRTLLQFLVERGVKALVFGFEKTAISGDSPEDSFTSDFEEIVKLVKAENLLLYIACYKNEENAEAFEIYQQRVVEALKRIGIDEENVFFANPLRGQLKPLHPEYLEKIRDKNLAGEEIVCIDSEKVNVQKAAIHRHLAIHSDENGFDLATLATVAPL